MKIAFKMTVRPEVSKGTHADHASIPQHERDRAHRDLERKLVSGESALLAPAQNGGAWTHAPVAARTAVLRQDLR